MAKRGVVAIRFIALAARTVGAQESLPPRTVAAVKDATIMIATTDPDDPGVGVSGSGFLFRAEGQKGYVLSFPGLRGLGARGLGLRGPAPARRAAQRKCEVPGRDDAVELQDPPHGGEVRWRDLFGSGRPG
jgi:hypothetical protein